MRERDLDPNDERVQLSRFGREVELFLASDIGTFMMDRARHVSSEATVKLIGNAHTMTRDEIRDQQTLIAFGTSFESWLTEAVESGHAALELLKEDDHGG